MPGTVCADASCRGRPWSAPRPPSRAVDDPPQYAPSPAHEELSSELPSPEQVTAQALVLDPLGLQASDEVESAGPFLLERPFETLERAQHAVVQIFFVDGVVAVGVQAVAPELGSIGP